MKLVPRFVLYYLCECEGLWFFVCCSYENYNFIRRKMGTKPLHIDNCSFINHDLLLIS